MALYDGFFDAEPVLDENGQETGKYDREYNSGHFTDYFANIIGSGVCIHNNPDSFKVRLEGGEAVVGSGYLFIQGYWLRNDEDYPVPVTGSESAAIVAHLNMGRRMIELETVPVAESYPDSLVLALYNPADGTFEDTRHNDDICGVIVTAGELSAKVEWAVNYIDNEIEKKLAQIEADILAYQEEVNAQIAQKEEELDNKIAEAQAKIDRVVPDPIGTIKYSAAENMGPNWLRCNGDFINRTNYPELVSSLGKLEPSGDQFKLISEGEIGKQISNGAVCNGRVWVYSLSTKKLYGVDLEGVRPIKEISVTSTNAYFNNFQNPSNGLPIALSIIPLKTRPGQYKLCLAQSLPGGIGKTNNVTGTQYITCSPSKSLLFWSNFTGNESSLTLVRPFNSIEEKPHSGGYIGDNPYKAIPYVVSHAVNGAERFSFYPYGPGKGDSRDGYYSRTYYFSWSESFSIADVDIAMDTYVNEQSNIFSFSHKNQDECAFMIFSGASYPSYVKIKSIPLGTFDGMGSSDRYDQVTESSPTTTMVTGKNAIITQVDPYANNIYVFNRRSKDHIIKIPVNLYGLPSARKSFIDGAVYLWNKDIYMIFVGTGIIFSRTLGTGSFGYLDTTSVLGIITQFGYLDYAENENTLYVLGQDTENRVKVAKMELNTLYDYATEGAWLPTLSMGGVPAYIKAKEGWS